MRAVVLSLAVLSGGVYIAGTLGLLPEPVSHYFESEWDTEQRMERDRILKQVADAKAGDAEAQYRYAVMLLIRDDPDGTLPDYVKQDPKAAIEMLQAAAAQGHSLARQALAMAHFGDELIPLDKQRVFELYAAEAAEGNAGANAMVGGMYERGWGTAQDDAKAAEHYLVAAGRGMATSRERLKAMLKDGRLPDAMRDQVAAYEISSHRVSMLEGTFSIANNNRVTELDARKLLDIPRWRSDLNAAVMLWGAYGDEADAEGFFIRNYMRAHKEAEADDIARLGWMVVQEARDPHTETGRAAALSATMSAEDVAAAEALAKTAIAEWDSAQ